MIGKNSMKKTLTAKILEFIWENPGATIKDVAIMLNIGLPTARAILYKLKNNGYIEKIGMGYVLTSKGEWFINNVLQRKTNNSKQIMQETREPIEHKEQATSEKEDQIIEVEKEKDYKSTMTEPQEPLKENILSRINLLESKIIELEKTVQKIITDLEAIKSKIKKEEEHEDTSRKKEPLKSKSNIELGTKKRDKDHENRLPAPIMYIYEAKNTLGPLLDTLIRSGKAEIIGSLVVDTEFYNEFKKRFPISITEAEKLPPMERRLLEEMNREAIVIIHAGKYYKLIK